MYRGRLFQDGKNSSGREREKNKKGEVKGEREGKKGEVKSARRGETPARISQSAKSRRGVGESAERI